MKKLDLIVKPEAEEDLVQAYTWYQERRLGLGDDFLMSIEAIFGLIRRNPNRFLVKYRNVRRALVNRFPYTALFTIEGSRIVILAIIHEKRDPKYSKKRSGID